MLLFVRSYPLTSLDFLKNLKVIHGTELQNDVSSLFFCFMSSMVEKYFPSLYILRTLLCLFTTTTISKGFGHRVLIFKFSKVASYFHPMINYVRISYKIFSIKLDKMQQMSISSQTEVGIFVIRQF